ncbi:MAG TPA: PTS sugar transporter subunit IIA [Candidatus Omnitrophota bacterium]|jgi:mannitol/fructose-specific phosphotransferase system IIA component (Ntr-type)|nr:PTS sugar transporter subunit IIA [Candidatus Omnitrophota bacterium]
MASVVAPITAPPAVELHLRSDLFISDLRTRKKASVLEEIAGALAAAKVARAPEAILDALRRREALGSTGLGKGIAVPHARSTMVSERALLVARSSKGIEFDAVDGQPVHLCFLIVAPPLERDPIYLKLVAEIVRATRLARTRQKLIDAPDFATLRTILVEAARD